MDAARGRGTGKTDGFAVYLDEHVHGPPCDPRVPAGHRPGIIAPTQGDAVDSCVTGPSGLKSHNPAVTLKTKAGGTYAYWPNGTEAKLFGAFTPEDVERLRAGGNRCI
jgi:phage terminase large subunit-like protein